MIIGILAAAALSTAPSPNTLYFDDGRQMARQELTLRSLQAFQITGDGRTVLTITKEGRMVPGQGLSADKATRKTFNVMVKMWPSLIDQWARQHGYVKPDDDRNCVISGGENSGSIIQNCSR